MPILNKTYIYLRRALTGAFLFSACAATQGQVADINKEFDFWGLKSLTFDKSSLDDASIAILADSIQKGDPILSNMSLTEISAADLWLPSAAAEKKLQFGFKNEGEASSLFAVGGQELTIARALDWRVVYEPGNASEFSPNALVFAAGIGGPSRVTFSEAAVFSALNKSDQGVPVVFVDEGSEVIFKESLDLVDYSTVKQDSFHLLKNSELRMEAKSQVATSATAFSLGKSARVWSTNALEIEAGTAFKLEDQSLLHVRGALKVKAESIFAGTGSIEVEEAAVVLEGGLCDFNGKYSQKNGSFVLTSDHRLTDAHWRFDGVSITTQSSNIFEVSAADYVSGQALQGTITQTGIPGSAQGKPFTEIVLTDETVSLEYLNRATKYYEGANVICGGDIYIDETLINYVTLGNHYGLLDNPNVGLASVRLHLLDETVLSDKDIKIGSLTNNSGKLSLSQSNIVLYAGAGQGFSGGLKFIGLTNKSSLTLYGLQSTQKQPSFGILEAAVFVEEGSELNFVGKNQVFENALIINTGKTKFSAFSVTESISDFYQVEGETVIESEAKFETNKSFEIYGGSLSVVGSLDARRLSIQNAQAEVGGRIRAEQLTLGSVSRDASSVLRINGGAEVAVAQANLQNALIVISGAPESGATSSLLIKDWEGSGNQIAVEAGGLLILGDDLSGDGLGYSRSESLEILTQFESTNKAVLVVNETQRLCGDNQITVGSVQARKDEASFSFGADSALLLRGRSEAPAFTADPGNTLAFREGSAILVVDPFGTNQLTDSTIEDFDGRELVELVSLNKNVQLSFTNVEGHGWFIQREQIYEQDFLYPELQGWLYEHPEGFTVDSENVAQKFFARADNDAFMNSGQSHALMAESTQLASLLGTRTNFYLFSQNALRLKEKELFNRFSFPNEGPRVYGSLGGRFFVSHDLNGYLGEASYRAAAQDIRFGVAALSSGWAWSVELGAGIVSSKSLHTVIDAKANHYLFDLSAAGAKQWGKFKMQANVGLGYAFNRLRADLPRSMEMGRLKGRVHDKYVTAGVGASYDITSNIAVRFSPQVWMFPKVSEHTKIESRRAFELKTKNQTFVEFPLSVKGDWTLGSVKDARIELGSELGGAVKAGKLDKKGTLHAFGTGAKELITQREFRRWSGFGALELRVKKSRLEGVLSASASTGDGKIQSTLSAKVNWKF